MTIEFLSEQKTKYQQKVEYFKNLCFDNLADEFQVVVNLIDKMADHLKEKTE